MPIRFRSDPVRKAKRLIHGGRMQSSELGRSIAAIAQGELWKGDRRADGQLFVSFAEFVTAAQPYGLGITTQEAMDELGVVLHKCRLYGIWKELIEATTRQRGRPRTNLAGSANKVPGFKLPTSHTARAKQVMLLAKHHPAVFAELEAGKLTLAEAVVAAGLSKPRRRPKLRFGVLDQEKARTLSDGAQRKLLREVFTAVRLDAQCHLLANVVAPATDCVGLAAKWRSWATRATREGHPNK